MKENYKMVHYPDWSIDYIPVEPTLEETQKKIKELKKKSRRLKFKKGLHTLQTIGVICSGIIVLPTTISLIGAHFGHSPFKYEEVKRPAYIKTIFDSDGNKVVSKQYEPYEDMRSKVTYYSEWTDIGDKYASVTTTYDVSGYSFEEVDGVIRFKDLPSSEPVEDIVFSDDMPDKKGDYYVGVIYVQDSKDYIMTPQTEAENTEDVNNTLAKPLLLGIMTMVPALLYLRLGNNTPIDKLHDAIREDNEITYELEDAKELALKLKNNKKVS